MVCTEKYGNWQVEKKLTAGAMEAQKTRGWGGHSISLEPPSSADSVKATSFDQIIFHGQTLF